MVHIKGTYWGRELKGVNWCASTALPTSGREIESVCCKISFKFFKLDTVGKCYAWVELEIYAKC